MPIARTRICNDDGSQRTGTVLNNDWKQELYNQIDDADAFDTADAPWRDIPFVAANWRANTPDGPGLGPTVHCNRWRPIGSNLVFWQLSVSPIGLPAPTGRLILLDLPFAIADQTVIPVAFAPVPSYGQDGVAIGGAATMMYWATLTGADWPGEPWLHIGAPVPVTGWV